MGIDVAMLLYPSLLSIHGCESSIPASFPRGQTSLKFQRPIQDETVTGITEPDEARSSKLRFENGNFTGSLAQRPSRSIFQ